MGPKINRVLGWACLAGVALTCAACDRPPAANTGKPVIAVSIFPVANLVSQLTSTWAEVVTLLPASASPHDAELTADQVRQISRADLLIVVGLGLDPWAEKGAEAAGSKRLAILRYADLIEHAGSNNHLWLDPVLAAQFVAGLAERLKTQYPEHSAQITASADKLTKDLQALDAEYRDRLAGVPERRLITFHNAFDLIAERYHLQIVARLTEIELTPGGEVTPDKLREAVAAIKEHKLRAIYAETEFPRQAVEKLHDETGVEVFELDPQGNPAVPGYTTYQEMMRSNLQTLVKGQSLK